MRITKLLITVVAICVLVEAVSAQRGGSRRARRDVHISKQHPTIYITFEGSGRERDVWLRLHNNTRWVIQVPAVEMYMGRDVVPYRLADEYRLAGKGRGAVAKPRYYVERSDGTPVTTDQVDTSFGAPVPPGHSVLFNVSREHLSKGHRVYLIFSYQWESGQDYEGAREPIHRVGFDGDRLLERHR